MHKQVEIVIDGKKTKIDYKIAKLIKALNDYGFKTLYSCQGSRENCGYIKFDENVDLEKAKDAFNILMPKHIAILDSDQCIRFFESVNAWKNYYDFLKRLQKNNLEVLFANKKVKSLEYEKPEKERR